MLVFNINRQYRTSTVSATSQEQRLVLTMKDNDVTLISKKKKKPKHILAETQIFLLFPAGDECPCSNIIRAVLLNLSLIHKVTLLIRFDTCPHRPPVNTCNFVIC